MGGMHGLGELRYEKDEPVFHAPWEGRVAALNIALGAFGKWRGLRPEIELIPAANYLRMSYYEKWLTALIQRIRKNGLASQEEIDTGRADKSSAKATPALTAASARDAVLRTPRTELSIEIAPRFTVGDRVRARNMHPSTHSRIPRYTRGRIGVVERDRGVFPLPDNDVYFLDPKPQHVYLIRFTARELWGDAASPRDTVRIDLWEDYLEPA
jgi:nitrile hydratase